MPYLNSETFSNLDEIQDIPTGKLLVLDNYAFNVDELKDYAENNLYNFFNNPHITDKNKNREFSDDAKIKLREHPVLGKYAKTLEDRLAAQKDGIKAETVDAVIKMLQAFHDKGEDGSDKAREDFFTYRETLTPIEQKWLDEFSIRVPVRGGGTENMSFAAAFMGGSNIVPCIVTSQNFLWQFVVMMRPQAFALVPEEVKRAAFSQHLLINGQAPAEQNAGHQMTDRFSISFNFRLSRNGHVSAQQISNALDSALLQVLLQAVRGNIPLELFPQALEMTADSVMETVALTEVTQALFSNHRRNPNRDDANESNRRIRLG